MFFGLFGKKNSVPIQKKSFAQLINNFFNDLDLLGSQSDYINDGYMRNPIVYRCIEERSKAISGLDLELHKSTTKGNQQIKEVLVNHTILDLLSRPNPFQTQKALFKELVIQLDTTGACFLLAIKDSKGLPIQLMMLPSADMTIVEGKNLFPEKYIYKKGTGDEKVYPIDQITGACDVLCIKNSNPALPQQGLSAMQPGWAAVEIFNQGMRFNGSLLKNGARPSGLLSAPDALTEEQYQALAEQLKTSFQGTDNSGSVPILEAGLQWQELGKSPKDMDFLAGMNASAMYIASVYGVPFPLVIPDSATFNNVKDARISLYENTIIPLAEDILEPLGEWLIQMFKSGDTRAKAGAYAGMCLTFDPDKILALEARRAERADRTAKLVGAGILTQNEARVLIGFDTVTDPEADKLLKPKSGVSTNLIPTQEGA